MQKKTGKKKAKGKIASQPSARRKAPPRPAQTRAAPTKRAKPAGKGKKVGTAKAGRATRKAR